MRWEGDLELGGDMGNNSSRSRALARAVEAGDDGGDDDGSERVVGVEGVDVAAAATAASINKQRQNQRSARCVEEPNRKQRPSYFTASLSTIY